MSVSEHQLILDDVSSYSTTDLISKEGKSIVWNEEGNDWLNDVKKELSGNFLRTTPMP